MISVSITDALDPQGRCGLQVESRWGPDEQCWVAAVREPLIGNWQELGGGGLAGSRGSAVLQRGAVCWASGGISAV